MGKNVGEVKLLPLVLAQWTKKLFYHHGHTRMGYLEVRNSHAWQACCEDLVAQLKELGFCAGQIYAIDVHCNNPDEDAIISAHWHDDPIGCDNNQCELEFEILNDNDDWSVHYDWCDERARALREERKRIIGVSHTINCDNRGVTVIFYEHHNPYKFL